MKTVFVWSAIPALTAAVTWVGVAPQRKASPTGVVAYLSVQRITNETREGKDGLARVQALQRERGDEVRQKQQALEVIRNQLSLAQPEARLRLMSQEQQQRLELERAVARGQADLQSLQRQMNAEMNARVRTVVAEIVKGQDIQVVLNLEAAVVWAAPSIDLTDAVIGRMNATPSAPPK
jgi:Skp family chaperone for outer membrane proteins